MNESLEALKALGLNIETWDPFLTRMITLKWDSETNERYEQHVMQPKQLQKLTDIMDFLQRRFMSLEASASNDITHHRPNRIRNHYSTSLGRVCWFCNTHMHNIYSCRRFSALSTTERNKAVYTNKKCRRCLNHDRNEQCHTTGKCTQCGSQDHHSFLHPNERSIQQPVRDHRPPYREVKDMPTPSTSTSREIIRTTSNIATNASREVTLLPTAEVQARAADGAMHRLRVLCDQGSEASFCTEHVAQIMAYPRTKIRAEICGIGDEKPKTSNYSMNMVLEPRLPTGYKLPIKPIILPKLTSSLPNRDVPALKSQYIADLLLADPNYNNKSPIDIILGAQEYSKLLLNGFYNVQEGVIAQNTKFGWILSGVCDSDRSTNKLRILSMMTTTTLEEVKGEVNLTNEDEVCEEYNQESTIRNEDRSYTIQQPKINTQQEYGNSRPRAEERLIPIEKNLEKENKLKKLQQNLKMEHMKRCKEDKKKVEYYVLQRPMEKEKLHQTKPTQKKDKKQQKEEIKKEVLENNLRTDTYGTSSAPNVREKTKQHLPKHEEANLPLASSITLEDVEDVDKLLPANRSQRGRIQPHRIEGFHVRKRNSRYNKLIPIIRHENKNKKIMKISIHKTRIMPEIRQKTKIKKKDRKLHQIMVYMEQGNELWEQYLLTKHTGNIRITSNHLKTRKEAVEMADKLEDTKDTLTNRCNEGLQIMKGELWKSRSKHYVHQRDEWKTNQQKTEIKTVKLKKEENEAEDTYTILIKEEDEREKN